MAREDIIEGLKTAINKGQSLEQGKQSFLNAGYLQEEIDAAVKNMDNKEMIKLNTLLPKKIIKQNKIIKKQKIEIKKEPKTDEFGIPEPEDNEKEKKSKQVVSNYTQKKKGHGGDIAVIIILIVLLLILIGGLVSFILYKDHILSYFASYFS